MGWCVVHPAGLAFCCRSRLTSNVGRVMTTLTYARWAQHPPTRLPELEGCIADITDAIDFVARLEALLTAPLRDYVLLDAYATALIIRYARSFKGGRRGELKLKDALHLSDEERTMHVRVLGIRDRHIAHPVNRFETQALFVGFDPAAGPQARATALSTGTRTQIALDSHDLRVIQSLLRKWYAHLREQHAAECARLLPIAQELSAAELLSFPVGPVEPDMNPSRLRSQSAQ